MTGRRPRATGNVGQGRRRRAIGPVARVVAFVVIALLLAACAGADLPQDTLAPEGPVARDQKWLWDIVFAIAVFVFVVVEVALVVLLVKFRAKPGDDTLPKQTHGNARLEVLWTLIPALILAGIAVPTVQMIFKLSATAEDALQVRVVGKQYWWEFEYLGDEGKGVVTANELVVPVGRPVQVTLESTGQNSGEGVAASPKDPGVIHSFWVPKLARKQDVVPGHTRHLTFTAETPGKYYDGQCAEFCGLSHANMRFAVLALEPGEFETWIEDHAAPKPPPSSGDGAAGAALFAERQCIACHSINGYDGAEARVGPNLTFFAERKKFAGYILENDVNDSGENVKAWLANPAEVKPGSQMPNLGLQPQEIEDLVAYLRTLQ